MSGYGEGNQLGGGCGNDGAWPQDLYADGYQENIYEVNPGDTPYSESFANPNPELGSSWVSPGSQYGGYSDEDQLEL